MAFDTKAPENDIAELIAASLAGFTVGTNVFVNHTPPKTPKDGPYITVYNTNGFDPLATVGATNEMPTIQIKVLSTPAGDLIARQTAQKIKELLHLITPFTTAQGTRYTGIWQQGAILPLGRNGNKQIEYSINFRIHRAY